MKSKITIPKEIIANIALYNTINGGVVEPQSNISAGKEGYDITVKVPSLKADNFQIEIINNRLMIYHALPVFATQPAGFESDSVARILGNMYIPNDADVEGIAARYDEKLDRLHVFLPYNQLHEGYRRHIEVDKW